MVTFGDGDVIGCRFVEEGFDIIIASASPERHIIANPQSRLALVEIIQIIQLVIHLIANIFG